MSKGRRVTPIISSPGSSRTESFKRPDHPDFWTSDECKKKEFSGVRQNNIAVRWEFWILGEMVRAISFEEVAKDKFALTRAHCDVFYMTPDPKLFSR